MKNDLDTSILLEQFSRIYYAEKEKLPYHINLLDDLRVDENAHSKILQKLLKYHTSKTLRYEILENFIEFVLEKYPEKTEFKKILVSLPLITQEVQRIDLWIRDSGKYAIIFENKVKNAIDQKDQLQRYIESTKQAGFGEEQIFVIYLPPTYQKEPDVYSWGHYYEGNIQTDRFLNLSFKDDILPWLKNKLLPEIKLKDKFLISSIEQYIDYLEGLFSLRIDLKKMNMELQKFISEALKLKTIEPEIAINKLNSKKEEIQNLLNQLSDIESKMIQDFFISWSLDLERDYPELRIVGNWESVSNFINIGVVIEKDNVFFTLLIEYSPNDGVYYGIGRHYASEHLNIELNFNDTISKFHLSTTRSYGWWYAWKNSSFKDVYFGLKELIDDYIV